RGVEDGAGSDDAGDLALDETAALGRLADLVADGDFVAGGDEAGDVAFDGVVGDAGEGDALALAHLAAGEDDVEDLGGDLGVALEGLVEVAEAEEEDRVWEPRLDLEVLAAHRDDGGVACRPFLADRTECGGAHGGSAPG
ncbi:MAG: hypothetical protein QOF33_4306, partial [Thermomicrobiales bacterium]|nr:hypothetical protein [Thermomicrobiales bacterium]